MGGARSKKWGELPMRCAPGNLIIGPPEQRKELIMPRYVVERSFPDGLNIPITAEGAAACLGVVNKNAEQAVTWVHSYVSGDHLQSWCIYDGPSPEAIRKVAARNDLPVGSITEVQVLDPYFYRSA
jgi:hypothetical protein